VSPWLAAAFLAFLASSAANARPPSAPPSVTLLASGLEGGSAGSTVGPDGALYVTEGNGGKVYRVDPQTGDTTTFASGLPQGIVGIGGPVDVAFIDQTAYVLTSLIGPEFGTSDVVGIYRVDGPSSFTVIADLGAWSAANPPPPIFEIDLQTGNPYALQAYRGGLLVTDGHHNRVLQVSLDGEISELIQFGDIVPTGLDVRGNTIYMAEAGPVPHLPENGKIVSFTTRSSTVTQLAAGAPILVDVEFGPGNTLYGLSNGTYSGDPEGSPGLPNTGSLVRADGDGTFSVVVDGLNLPTSMEIIGNDVYVFNLAGEVWKINLKGDKEH
jgi:sugar lactone lactonase YvrE